MKRKYGKEKVITVDLSDRKKINIIESGKKVISDDEINMFRDQLNSRSEQAEEFCNYFIQKELENNPKISEDDFNATMKEIFKQHKIMKSLVKEQDDN